MIMPNKSYEELQAENDMLRHKLSPLEDKDFTVKLALKMADLDLTPFMRTYRGSPHIVLTPAELWALCFEGEPNNRDLTVLGRSLQALCWERSALYGHLRFVMTVEEYQHQE